ncbi:tyrosine-type recombinase/integrase [Streptomyces sp. NPDC004752]
MGISTVLEEKWPVFGRHEQAAEWLQVWTDLGRAPRTIDAYARGLAEYLQVCEREDVDPVAASRVHVAVFVRELTTRPNRRGPNVLAIDSGAGLANATLQQRLVPVRLFYDFLIEEGLRESNPVGRGRYTPGRRFGGHQRGLVPRLTKLPWIPGEQQWLHVLSAFRDEPIRNRVMLALAYDAALRREELCSLRTDDLDPARRMLRIRAETTKNRLERVVSYSAATGALLSCYLAHFAQSSYVRAQEQGRAHGELEPHNTDTLNLLRGAVDTRPKDWAAFQKHTVEFHLRNAAAWANEATGQDLAAQVDLDFQHGPAALTVFA